MRLLLRAILLFVLVALVLVSLALVLRPSSRQLAPVWLFYDLVGRRASALPAPAEQWLLAQGQDFCNRGHDTDCGGYRVTAARRLTMSPAAGSQGTAMACVSITPCCGATPGA